MPSASRTARRAGLLLLAFSLGSAAPALAASPLEDYIAARDAAIAQLAGEEFSNPDNWEKARDINQAQLGKLEGMVRAIIGAPVIAGFEKKGHFAVETLVQEMGFGRVDGIAYNATKGTAIATVTTVPLMEAWAKGQMALYPDIEPPLPLKAPQIIASTEALNMALVNDAAIVSVLKLPLSTPAGASAATAVLGVVAQDMAPIAPDTLFVSVIRGDKVTLFSETLDPPPQASPTCTGPWEKATKQVERLNQGGKEEDFAKAVDVETKAMDAFWACIAQTLPKQPEFAAAAKRAQALADVAP